MQQSVIVSLHDVPAGWLRQTAQGYEFEYLPDYNGLPLSLSLPLAQRRFSSPTLFPYFASLVPEGWLKKRYSDIQKIDENDLFSLLINNGSNLIGAVSIKGA